MRISLAVLLVLTLAAGCSNKEASQTSPSPAARADNASSRYLAYEHAMRLDTDEDKVAAVFEAAQAACKQAVEAQCVVLNSRLSSGRNVSAELKFRAKPSGIQQLMAQLGTQGRVASQSTTAIDLAAPIQDSAKKLEMLQDYRSKLEALRTGAAGNIDALIKVNKELASVQSELEAMAGTKAQLVQRVETEILNVSIGSEQRESFWKPITLALSNFASNLSQAVSIAITGVAYLLPWALLLAVLGWVGRKLWRWKRAARKEGPV
jgi:Domain of unknown function (DUF4349)